MEFVLGIGKWVEQGDEQRALNRLVWKTEHRHERKVHQHYSGILTAVFSVEYDLDPLTNPDRELSAKKWSSTIEVSRTNSAFFFFFFFVFFFFVDVGPPERIVCG